jgi:ferredoxin
VTSAHAAACRGSYGLGTACGRCRECETDPSKPSADDLIERGSVCPETGKEHREFDPGQCDDCGRCFRCPDCGTADHPFISRKVAADIDARAKESTP